MHRFRIHPPDPPDTSMPWLLFRGDISNAPVPSVISDVRRTATRVPIQKEAWPAMVMHGNRLPCCWHADFKNANEFIFKDDSVGRGSGLDSIVSAGEFRFILSEEIEMPSEKEGQ